MAETETKEMNKSAIKNALIDIVDAPKPTLDKGYSVTSQPVEIHTRKKIEASLSEIIMDAQTAQRVDTDSAMALRMKDADLGVRLSLHDKDSVTYSADASLQQNEVAFTQMYVTYDQKNQAAYVEIYVEVSDNYNGEDLQGFGLGSSLMPTSDFDPREQVITPIIKQKYPDAKKIVIATGDVAHGKGNHERTKWTTDIVVKAGYKPHGSKFIKIIDL